VPRERIAMIWTSTLGQESFARQHAAFIDRLGKLPPRPRAAALPAAPAATMPQRAAKEEVVS
jgi:hypothetical protein